MAVVYDCRSSHVIVAAVLLMSFGKVKGAVLCSLSVCLSVRCIESNLRATDCFNNKKKKMNLRHVTNLRPALLVDWKMTVESPGDS